MPHKEMETATIIRHIRLLVGHLHRNGVDYAALQREIFGDGGEALPLRREEPCDGGEALPLRREKPGNVGKALPLRREIFGGNVEYPTLSEEKHSGDADNSHSIPNLKSLDEDGSNVRLRSVLHAGKRRGYLSLHGHGAEIYLNPMERTLYRLFLSHPEGIAADSLPLYWNELRHIYFKESRYDDKSLMESKLESLCAESKTVFYSTVSRIKKKFTDAIGPDKADAFIIKRDHTGRYKTKATIR